MDDSYASLYKQLSPSQLDILEDFKVYLREHEPKMIEDTKVDYMLTKWLVARQFSFENSLKMWRNHKHWVATSLQSYMLSEVPLRKDYSSEIPMSRLGSSKYGHPVIYSILGRFDIQGVRKYIPYSEFINSLFKAVKQCRKWLFEQSAAVGHDVDQLYFVVDFEGLKYINISDDFVSMIIMLSGAIQDQSPEMVSKIFFVNSNHIVTVIFKLASHLLTERLKSKIYVLSSSKIEDMFKFIDKDQVPAYYGGTLSNSQSAEECRQLITWPSEFEDSDFLKTAVAMESKDDYICLNVSRREKVHIYVGYFDQVRYIHWEFFTEDHDIGFALVFNATESSPDDGNVLGHVFRLNTHFVVEIGHFPANFPGHYYLLFDNTYSRFTSKTVHYKWSIKETA